MQPSGFFVLDGVYDGYRRRETEVKLSARVSVFWCEREEDIKSTKVSARSPLSSVKVNPRFQRRSKSPDIP